MRIAILGATGQTGKTWVSILPIEEMLEKSILRHFFVSGLQAVLQALDSGHSVTALVKEYFSPLHLFFISSLHYFIFAAPLRCAVQTSWPISPTLLSLWQNATFSGFTFFFPFFPFSPLSKSYLKSQSGAAEQPPWRARRGALLSRLQTTEARGHVSST